MYVGEWADNEQNGQGTLTRPNGVVMEGIWKDGDLSKATVKYRNGDVYHGDLKDDVRRHGVAYIDTNRLATSTLENGRRASKQEKAQWSTPTVQDMKENGREATGMARGK